VRKRGVGVEEVWVGVFSILGWGGWNGLNSSTSSHWDAPRTMDSVAVCTYDKILDVHAA